MTGRAGRIDRTHPASVRSRYVVHVSLCVQPEPPDLNDRLPHANSQVMTGRSTVPRSDAPLPSLVVSREVPCTTGRVSLITTRRICSNMTERLCFPESGHFQHDRTHHLSPVILRLPRVTAVPHATTSTYVSTDRTQALSVRSLFTPASDHKTEIECSLLPLMDASVLPRLASGHSQ